MMDREPRTLNFWRNKLAHLPQTIECREMRLFGRDHEPDVFTGPGRIEVKNATEIRFFMYGTTADSSAAFRKLVSAQRNPYKTLEQFRLAAVDYGGVEWAGGWTQVDFFTDVKSGWPLTGELGSLSTLATGDWVAKTSGVELLLIPPVELPVTEWMASTTKLGAEEIEYSRKPGRQIVKALGTTIEFAYEPSGEALWITAPTNDAFQHPYAENWLTEPLRIMLGSLIYPRMIARNTGDGRAHVCLRPSPRHQNQAPFALMPPFGIGAGHIPTFWGLYARTLTLIGSARDKDGHPNFDPHDITRFYQELAQSQRGSHWVMLLTLASTAEAMTKSLMTDQDRKSDFADADLAAMKAYLDAWTGNGNLRDRMKSNLGMAAGRSPQGFMRRLSKEGVIGGDEVGTWIKLRNSVMHGELAEPWSTEENDQHLREMISLVHKLTHAVIRKG